MLISVTELKAKCLSVIARVESTGEPIIVTKHGAAIAEIRPLSGSGAAAQDALQGSVKIVGDILGPVLPPEAWESEEAQASKLLKMFASKKRLLPKRRSKKGAKGR